jgi:hypothetical protein
VEDWGNSAAMYKIIGADLKEYGPVSADQLRQWLNEGRVNGQTKIQAADTTEWKTLAEMPEFALLLPKTQAPLPPPVRPVPIAPLPQQATSQLAIWAMIAGICSLLCCCGWFIVPPTAIVLGAVALARLKSHPELTGHGFAIAGLVLGILALLVYLVATILVLSNPEYMRQIQSAIPQQ